MVSSTVGQICRAKSITSDPEEVNSSESFPWQLIKMCFFFSFVCFSGATLLMCIDIGIGAIRCKIDGVKMTYGDAITLYGSGSGLQPYVTGFYKVADSYWIVRRVLGASGLEDCIRTGTLVTLHTLGTGEWLHTCFQAFPISGNSEVRSFCIQGEKSDTGDYWRLEMEGRKCCWRQNQKVKLYLVDASEYLHTDDKDNPHINEGQPEVCAIREKSDEDVWVEAHGAEMSWVEQVQEFCGVSEKSDDAWLAGNGAATNRTCSLAKLGR